MHKLVPPLVSAMLVVPFLHAAAHAAPPAPRVFTYVSGQGSDNGTCSAGLPCRTLAAALASTVPGGVIYVLNSANFGPVTIGQSISITSEGTVAGILVTSGAAITINAGANDVVNLRGLSIEGGNSASVGIQFNSGKSLTIQKTTVRNFTNSGIVFAPSTASLLYVSDTTVLSNTNNGISITNGSGALSRVTATQNGVGILASGGSTNVTISDSVASNNSYGVGAIASNVMIRSSSASNNSVGISADQSAVIRVGQTTATANGTGWQATNGGQVVSFTNNVVSGNTADGTSTSTIALQ